VSSDAARQARCSATGAGTAAAAAVVSLLLLLQPLLLVLLCIGNFMITSKLLLIN